MVREGIEQLGGLAAVAQPQPVVAVERSALSPNADPTAVFHDAALHFIGRQHLHRAEHQRIVLGEDFSRIDALAEGPLPARRKLRRLRPHNRRDVAISVCVRLGIACDCLAERLLEIAVLFAPRRRILRLAEPLSRFAGRSTEQGYRSASSQGQRYQNPPRQQYQSSRQYQSTSRQSGASSQGQRFQGESRSQYQSSRQYSSPQISRTPQTQRFEGQSRQNLQSSPQYRSAPRVSTEIVGQVGVDPVDQGRL